MKMLRYITMAVLALAFCATSRAQGITGMAPNVPVSPSRVCYVINQNSNPVAPSILQTTGGCITGSQGTAFGTFSYFKATLDSVNQTGGDLVVFIEDMTAGTYVAGCSIANGTSTCSTTSIAAPVAIGDVLATSIYSSTGSQTVTVYWFLQ